MTDLRRRIAYVRSNGDISETWLGVPSSDRFNITMKEHMNQEGDVAIEVPIDFYPHRRKYDFNKKEFGPVEITPFEKYSKMDIARAIKNNDRAILDELAAEADKAEA